MDGDPDIDDWMGTVADRVEFLELLDGEGPLGHRDVVEAVPYSRGTVTRALRELREAGLVEKVEGGNVPTVPGVMAADAYTGYRDTMRAILDSKGLLAALSDPDALPAEVLVGAEVVRAESEMPVRPLEAVSERVRGAETVRAYLPTLVNTHLARVWHRTVVGTGGDHEAVFDPALLTNLKGQYPHLLSEMATAEGFSAHATEGPAYGLFLTETDGATTGTVVVYEDDTAVRGVLTNLSPAGVEWARSELDRLEAGATEVTGDLRALSAAVPDGGPHRGGATAATGATAAAPVESAGHALPLALESEGFVRLSAEYFDAHGEADPAVSWRTGFTLAEVHAGHAVDRRDEDGRDLTGHLVEQLRSGADHVLLGPPGSGKSTVCMSVACEWYDRGLGPVLYRERGGDWLESTALLEAYLRRTDGHALVVVEDAVRDEANAVFEVMRTLDADESVTFLLDARTNEWHDADGVDLDASLDAYRRTAVEECHVPGLDRRECERLVEGFSALVDDDPDLSGGELYDRVEAGAARSAGGELSAGDALVAQHYLARTYGDPLDPAGETPTALEEAVGRTYEGLLDAEPDLAADLAVTVAALTAAGVPVAEEYCYAVAPDELAAVEEALSLLEGHLLFEHDDPRVGGPTTYRTRHETWAKRFLGEVVEREPAERPRERFGRCVTRVLALAEDPKRRERIERHLDGRTPFLHQVEADPGGWADELAERVFAVGRTDASLAVLFGETTGDALELPGACSNWTRLRTAYWRGKMNRTRGDLDRAEREFHALEELAESLDLPRESAANVPTPEYTTTPEQGEDLSTLRARWRAAARNALGETKWDTGEYEAAERHHEEALDLFREVDDRRGEANSLRMLGVVARLRDEYDRAREYCERALDTARDLDARDIEADTHGTLGYVAYGRSNYDRAKEHFERSLDVYRDLGDRHGAAKSLTTLGQVASTRGAFEEAREYYERSVAIYREVGARHDEAVGLNNLGVLAFRQGAYDEAREYYERSLEVIGDVENSPRQGGETHVNLGLIARKQGEYERAREHLDRALELFEPGGDRKGIAQVRVQEGLLALARDDHERARTRAEESRETFEELGDRYWRAWSDRVLGRTAAAADRPGEAREHLERALETCRTIGAMDQELETLEVLVEVCRDAGDEERASEWLDRARDRLAEAPDSTADDHREWVRDHAADLE